jgi:hypothetical protein
VTPGPPHPHAKPALAETIELQIGIADWLAVRLGATGLIYSGVNARAALAQGVLARYAADAGVTAAWNVGERIRVGAFLDGAYGRRDSLNVLRGVLRALETREVSPTPFLTTESWRWSTWMSVLGDGKEMLVILGLFIGFRVLGMALGDLGRADAANAVLLLWLGICVYSWTAPGIFARMIKRELAQVRLRSEF